MKGKNSPQIEATEHFAKKMFAELHQTITQHESGALEGGVEAIHDMRVGIRRLRVALNNFACCLPKEDRQRLRTTLERMAQALGCVRDLDVMIHTLKSKQTDKFEDDRMAIGAFIRRLRSRRRRRHLQLNRYLQSEEFVRFKDEFLASRQSESLSESLSDRGSKK